MRWRFFVSSGIILLLLVPLSVVSGASVARENDVVNRPPEDVLPISGWFEESDSVIGYVCSHHCGGQKDVADFWVVNGTIGDGIEVSVESQNDPDLADVKMEFCQLGDETYVCKQIGSGQEVGGNTILVNQASIGIRISTIDGFWEDGTKYELSVKIKHQEISEDAVMVVETHAHVAGTVCWSECDDKGVDPFDRIEIQAFVGDVLDVTLDSYADPYRGYVHMDVMTESGLWLSDEYILIDDDHIDVQIDIENVGFVIVLISSAPSNSGDLMTYTLNLEIDSSDRLWEHDEDGDGWTDWDEWLCGNEPQLGSDSPADFDGDSICDEVDLDDDNDGWLDVDERACGTDSMDGVSQPADFDGDGLCDVQDDDDDNDGWKDWLDDCPYNATEWWDFDGDGLCNGQDSDDDNDGVLDSVDDLPYNSLEWTDTDGDGIGDNADTDDDNDLVLDFDDGFPHDPYESVDTDGDGIGDNADSDDDNDGVEDWKDDYPLNPNRSVEGSLERMGEAVSANRNLVFIIGLGLILCLLLSPLLISAWGAEQELKKERQMQAVEVERRARAEEAQRARRRQKDERLRRERRVEEKRAQEERKDRAKWREADNQREKLRLEREIVEAKRIRKEVELDKVRAEEALLREKRVAMDCSTDSVRGNQLKCLQMIENDRAMQEHVCKYLDELATKSYLASKEKEKDMLPGMETRLLWVGVCHYTVTKNQLKRGERLAEMDEKRAYFDVFRAAAQYWRRCHRYEPLIENGWGDGVSACEEAAKRLDELQVSLDNL